MPANDPTLQKLRVAIDGVDRQLVRSLNLRANLEIDALRFGQPAATSQSNSLDDVAKARQDQIVAKNEGIIPASSREAEKISR